MRLTVVGCSGSYPGPDSPASCYLVEVDADREGGRPWRLLLDLGNGALGALHRYIDPLAVDAILLSHLHADHCIDITSYYEGHERSVKQFRVVAYEIPRGCAAAYFPEANPLVPLRHLALGSHQPASKSLIVRVFAAAMPAVGRAPSVQAE